MEARSEITIKFSGSLPIAKPAPNKKVEIELTDQNDSDVANFPTYAGQDFSDHLAGNYTDLGFMP